MSIIIFALESINLYLFHHLIFKEVLILWLVVASTSILWTDYANGTNVYNSNLQDPIKIKNSTNLTKTKVIIKDDWSFPLFYFAILVRIIFPDTPIQME